MRFKAEKVLGWTIPLSTLVRLQRQAIRKYLLQKVPITFLIHILLLIKYFCPAGKGTFRIPFLMENNIPNIFPNIINIISFLNWCSNCDHQAEVVFWILKDEETLHFFNCCRRPCFSEFCSLFFNLAENISAEKKEKGNEQKQPIKFS